MGVKDKKRMKGGSDFEQSYERQRRRERKLFNAALKRSPYAWNRTLKDSPVAHLEVGHTHYAVHDDGSYEVYDWTTGRVRDRGARISDGTNISAVEYVEERYLRRRGKAVPRK